MGRNADRAMGTRGERREGRREGKSRRFTAAFRMAVQNRRAIFFPRGESTRADPYSREARETPRIPLRRSPRGGHVIGRKRQKYAPIGRSSG